VLVNWENGDRRTSEGIVRDRLSARVSDAGVLRVKESTKLRIYCVWSISQSNYLVPLFCDSMLALCSLILSSGVLLIRSRDIDVSDHLPNHAGPRLNFVHAIY
jgi:hypothetical protein